MAGVLVTVLTSTFVIATYSPVRSRSLQSGCIASTNAPVAGRTLRTTVSVARPFPGRSKMIRNSRCVTLGGSHPSVNNS